MDLAQLEEIFHRCCSLDPEKRQSVIDSECAHDPELARMVSGLLAEFDRTAETGLEPFVPRITEHRSTTVLFEPEAASLSTLKAGSVLAERYEVIDFLAAGGMGQVYRVRDRQLDTILALKTIRPEIAADPRSLRRFKQEMLLARSISHPNVCRIFDLDHDEDTGVVFLTMEFLAGETLAERIDRQGRLAPEVCLALVEEMADALDAAHRAGIVHRDFKSPNVMLVPSGDGERVVVTDFGLAMTAAEDGNESIVGTPAYMAPEQVAGRPLGPAADLYALGVVLFEMCTGRLPFSGATPLETARAHVTLSPPKPSSLAAIDESWDTAILQLLAKDPGQRHRYAAEVVRDLEGRGDGPKVPPHAIPAELDAFVGRTEELRALAVHLESGQSSTSTPLLTLRGTGGTGKSRLARRYGWESLLRWPGGVWFCDLHEARTLDGISGSVAATLDVPLGRGDTIAQLGHAIAARGCCLIILDNFEQIAEHARTTVGAWCEHAPDARFLVTSRERLGLPQEETLELPPLDPQSRGVELFEVRAWGHRPAFLVDPSNRKQIGDIVRKLDGLPLAIELAASRLRTLNPEELQSGLADRFALLTGGAEGRHATLEATLDWSWNLLQPWEQSAVSQMAVFEGGLTLEAAESVLDLAYFKQVAPVVDIVQSLVDKSWLRTEAVHGLPRFQMYSTVHEYASGKLRQHSAAHLERRHGRHFARMGTEEAIEAVSGPRGVSVLKASHADLDNLIAACRRAAKRSDQMVAERTYAAAHSVLALRGPLATSIQLGHEVLDILESASLRGRVLYTLASATRLAGDNATSREHCQAALDAYRRAGDQHGEGLAHGNLGLTHYELSEYEQARVHFDEAIRLHRSTGHRSDEARAIGNLGMVFLDQGKTGETRLHYETCLAIHRGTGNRRDEGIVLGNLATLYTDLGELDKALEHYELALERSREVGNRGQEALVLANLGMLHQEQGRLRQAGELMETALRLQRELGSRRDEGLYLGYLGFLRYDQGRLEDARSLLERAIDIHREVNNPLFEASDLSHLGRVFHDSNQPKEARKTYVEALDLLRRVGDRFFEAIVRSNLGELDTEEGHYDSAMKQFEAALAFHEGRHDSLDAAITARGLGQLHLKLSRPEEARRCFTSSIETFRSLGDQLHLGLSLCALGKLEAEHGNHQPARRALSEAATIADALELAPESRLVHGVGELRSALPAE